MKVTSAALTVLCSLWNGAIAAKEEETRHLRSQEGKERLLVKFIPGKKGVVEQALNGMGGTIHHRIDPLNTIAVSVPIQAKQGLERNPNVEVSFISPVFMRQSTDLTLLVLLVS